jgi:hypothetical protein
MMLLSLKTEVPVLPLWTAEHIALENKTSLELSKRCYHHEILKKSKNNKNLKYIFFNIFISFLVFSASEFKKKN